MKEKTCAKCARLAVSAHHTEESSNAGLERIQQRPHQSGTNERGDHDLTGIFSLLWELYPATVEFRAVND